MWTIMWILISGIFELIESILTGLALISLIIGFALLMCLFITKRILISGLFELIESILTGLALISLIIGFALLMCLFL